jgi:glutamate dehydrogenase (NAD(P)+)/glutamate dehydrogenase (NADP+)
MSTADPIFELHDDLGPSKAVHLFDPADCRRTVVVVDNAACGPAS